MKRPKADLAPTAKLQGLFQLAATQAGHFTAGQARALGYTPRSIFHHINAGHFERVSRGFYRMAGIPAGPFEDVIAAWLKAGADRAVVSHDTALALYDLAPSRSHEVHLTLPRKHRPRNRLPGSAVALHTVIVPLRREEVTHRFGVRVTSPARTLVDTADLGAEPSVIIEATARALTTGLVSPRELRAMLKNRSARVKQVIERAIQEFHSRA
jgi:predicted transcriptional regulator of viral defense system